MANVPLTGLADATAQDVNSFTVQPNLLAQRLQNAKNQTLLKYVDPTAQANLNMLNMKTQFLPYLYTGQLLSGLGKAGDILNPMGVAGKINDPQIRAQAERDLTTGKTTLGGLNLDPYGPLRPFVTGMINLLSGRLGSGGLPPTLNSPTQNNTVQNTSASTSSPAPDAPSYDPNPTNSTSPDAINGTNANIARNLPLSTKQINNLRKKQGEPPISSDDQAAVNRSEAQSEEDATPDAVKKQLPDVKVLQTQIQDMQNNVMPAMIKYTGPKGVAAYKIEEAKAAAGQPVDPDFSALQAFGQTDHTILANMFRRAQGDSVKQATMNLINAATNPSESTLGQLNPVVASRNFENLKSVTNNIGNNYQAMINTPLSKIIPQNPDYFDEKKAYDALRNSKDPAGDLAKMPITQRVLINNYHKSLMSQQQNG